MFNGVQGYYVYLYHTPRIALSIFYEKANLEHGQNQRHILESKPTALEGEK
jgi:hypothetical protein